MATVLVNCKCKSPFQDRHYDGRRLANTMKKDATKARCTVCDATHAITASQIKANQ